MIEVDFHKLTTIGIYWDVGRLFFKYKNLLSVKIMKTIEQRERQLKTIAVSIFIAALIGAGIFYAFNRSISKKLDKEKLNSEMLLSEKLVLQKDIDGMKSQISSLSGKNTELDKLLVAANQKLDEKQIQFNKLVRENGNIKKLKKELAEITQLKIDFENQVSILNRTIQQMNNERDALNEKITSLQNENQLLTKNIEILSSVTSDDYLIQSIKRNQKSTVIARQTKKVTMSFKVSENMAENLSFKLINPDGKQVDVKRNEITYKVLNDNESLNAKLTGSIKVSKKIEMTYNPENKQKPGIYKIEMYNNDKYIGACNISLR